MDKLKGELNEDQTNGEKPVLYAFHNGRIMPLEETYIPAANKSFQSGYGLFETIKVSEGRPILFEVHMTRFKNSCQALRMDFTQVLFWEKQGNSSEQGTEDIFKKMAFCADQIIQISRLVEGTLKLMFTKVHDGYDFLMMTGLHRYTEEQYQKGFHIGMAQGRRNEKSIIVHHKTTSTLENLLERSMAQEKGFDEALFLNSRDHIAEGCISNVFWMKQGQLYTPDITCGILPGIMRQMIIADAAHRGIQVNIGHYSLENILFADEVFLTNALMGKMPVADIHVV